MDDPSIAAIRFGLGRTPGQDPGPDPATWLRRQLIQPDPAIAATTTLADAFAALRSDGEARRAQLPADAARQLFHADLGSLLATTVTTPAPFRERLVQFWANHFTVSVRAGMVAPLVAPYLRDAIRATVTGRFAEMLLAVMRHPAMLIYLNNGQSAGPNSVAAARRNAGLNENLARECLELHTVTPASGYTQADVAAFARTLTGWSIESQDGAGFRFRPLLHEPGEKVLLGRRIPEGQEGGVQVLNWLADHPATHRNLATKLVRHFVADVPPADSVRRVEGVLRDTRGNLGAAAAELVSLPAAWAPLTKVRTPFDYVVAALRATALQPDRRPGIPAALAGLGQPAFNAPAPIGWSDKGADWVAPEAMMRRMDWAHAFANHPGLPEPAQLADAALGSLLTPATVTALRQAGSRRDALTLLLTSPEFQRR